MKLLRSIGTMAAVFLLAFSISLYSFKAVRGPITKTRRPS